ncbi:MAG: hypothetical protein ACTSRA_04870 [Promethearchaeota archaeon]
MIAYIFPSTPPVIRAIFVTLYPFFIVIFVKKSYHSERKSAFKWVFGSIVALKASQFVIIVIFNFHVPTITLIRPEFYFVYFVQFSVTLVLNILPFIWWVKAAIHTYRNLKYSGIPDWIKFRNQLIIFSCILYILTPLAWIFIPWDGSGYKSAIGIVSLLYITLMTNFNSLIQILCWVIPNRFKRFLITKARKTGEYSFKMVVVPEDHSKVINNQKILNAPQVIGIIDFLGDSIARQVQKSPSAIKGLLMLTISSSFGTKGLYTIKLAELKEIILGDFKKRISELKVPNIDEIINQTISELVENQSIIMLLNA